MFTVRKKAFCLVAGAIGALSGPLTAAQAQDADRPRVPHHRLGRPERSRHVVAFSEPASERQLTIQPRPQVIPPGDEGGGDIYLDGNVRYNSIRTFSPAPYADSGRQYPFGLDGIGGYGSDLGFGAGHDDELYDRGP